MNEETLSLHTNKKFISEAKRAALIPLSFLAILIISHLLYCNYGAYFTDFFSNIDTINRIEYYSFYSALTIAGYWLFTRIINNIKITLFNSSLFINHPNFAIFLPFFIRMFKALAFLSLFNILIQQLHFSDDSSLFVNKATSILIIICISSLLFKLVDISEKLLSQHYESLSGTIAARKIVTKTLILKRVAYTVLTAVSIGAILILFDSVRALGTSVLTTAGLLGLVATFTAQRSLGSIFSGLEIALTQPIKIGDSVVIDNEKGVIEEINFRSVVIKLWDWRRLIVPTNYFLEKTFQNWSREQDNNLIASLTLYTDFTLPVNKVRTELDSILNASEFWDKDIGKLRVSDLREHAMELKVLASAKNASDAVELNCEIREKLIGFIAKNYPHCLPTTRNLDIKSNVFDNLEYKNRVRETT
ncbi:MAG: mechanosensitive ion channel [Tatlockia sp.]|nr:mechanosensitive ion channel [Tatlockia sp.]